MLKKYIYGICLQPKIIDNLWQTKSGKANVILVVLVAMPLDPGYFWFGIHISVLADH